MAAARHNSEREPAGGAESGRPRASSAKDAASRMRRKDLPPPENAYQFIKLHPFTLCDIYKKFMYNIVKIEIGNLPLPLQQGSKQEGQGKGKGA